MPRIRGPVGWVVVLAIGIYGAMLLTEPKPTHPRQNTGTGGGAATAVVGQAAVERFPRYRSSGRNVFAPRIVTARRSSPGAMGTNGGSWVLTGINAIDGSPSALVENDSTHESEFLQVGDRWQGLRVSGIAQDGLLLTDGRGQTTRMSFPEPPEEKPSGASSAQVAAPVTTGAPQARPQPMFANAPQAVPATGAGR